MRLRLLGLIVILGAFVAGPSVLASHKTIIWEGQKWDLSHNGTAAINAAGDLVLTRTSGTADMIAHIERVTPAPANQSAINANGTPWVRISYIDNGALRGVDFFIEDDVMGPSLNPRLQAGSLFSCQGLGYLRYGQGAGLVETFGFGEGCDEAALPGTMGSLRAAGQAHTIYVGQRADGTIDYNYDGQWFSSTFLKDATGPFKFNDVYLRLRGAQGTTAVFTNFEAGDDHVFALPETADDCKKGGWSTFTVPLSFKNQGQCIQFVNTGK